MSVQDASGKLQSSHFDHRTNSISAGSNRAASPTLQSIAGDWELVTCAFGRTGRSSPPPASVNGGSIELPAIEDSAKQVAVSDLSSECSAEVQRRASLVDGNFSHAQCNLQEARSQFLVTGERYMAVCNKAYMSLSDFNGSILQAASDSPGPRIECDAARRTALQQKLLLEHHWRKLNRAHQTLCELETGHSAENPTGTSQSRCCVSREDGINDASSALSDSSSNGPTNVHEYFRACRARYLIEERLNELTLDQALDLQSCMHCPEQSSQAPFQARYEELFQALAVAQREVDAQRDACLASGIDPERYRHRRISSRLSNHEHVTNWLQHHAE